MALANCRECGLQVSTEAYSCPHCGVPSPAGAFAPVPASAAKPAPKPVIPNVPPPPPRPANSGNDTAILLGLVGGIALLFLALIVLSNAGASSAPQAQPQPQGYSALDTAAGGVYLDTAIAAAPEPAHTWMVDSTKSPMDDSPIISLQLFAENEIPTPIEYKRPTLIVRCRERATSVYVMTETPAEVNWGNLDGGATVRLRLDAGKAFTESWGESTDQKALFAPTPVALARRIAGADTLRFEFTPYGAPRQTVTFAVAGLADKLGLVSSTCGWKSAPAAYQPGAPSRRSSQRLTAAGSPSSLQRPE